MLSGARSCCRLEQEQEVGSVYIFSIVRSHLLAQTTCNEEMRTHMDQTSKTSDEKFVFPTVVGHPGRKKVMSVTQ